MLCSQSPEPLSPGKETKTSLALMGTWGSDEEHGVLLYFGAGVKLPPPTELLFSLLGFAGGRR